ncbi:glycosyltransferase family 2 protein [Candidatus Daviesbacteria bacterium]|nr:glycosyltransferase family 2 protein [Candidatus Daviesbacteria bacterium]
MTVSVIIPAFNEQDTIVRCLFSLKDQTFPPLEIIVVDDGSNDDTFSQMQKLKDSLVYLKILQQAHQGPAKARNLAASYAQGDILVFVDADMEFDRHFLEMLTSPIINGTSQGTWTKEEKVANWDNLWARMWNLNEGWPEKSRIAVNASDKGTDFRAIVKSEFDRVGGFDDIGYTDVYTLARKLGYQPQAAPGAICYHYNPDSLTEVWVQARWIGKNEFISGNFIRRIWSLWRYGIVNSLLVAFTKSIITIQPAFVPFKLTYDLGIWCSVVLSFWGEPKIK